MKFKGQAANPLGILVGASIGLLVVGIIIAFALTFLSQTNATLAGMSGTNTTEAQAAVTSTMGAIGTLPGWLPMIVLAFVMVVVLGLVVGIVAYVSRIQGGGVQ